MKNRALLILLVSTGVILVFTFGFFLGRNAGGPAVITQHIAPTAETADIEAALETLIPETTVPEQTEPIYPININTATAEALDFLPGIGPELARRIVEYRDNNGDYLRCTDLLNVKGIGEGRLEDILPYITTGYPEQQEEPT